MSRVCKCCGTKLSCKRCGADLPPRKHYYCGKQCAVAAMRASWRQYRKSPKGRATRKAYEAKPEVREAILARDRRYRQKRRRHLEVGYRQRRKLLELARREAQQTKRSTWEVLRDWRAPLGLVSRPANVRHPLPANWRE